MLKYFELKNAAQIGKSSDEAAIEIEFLRKKLKQTQKQSSYDEEEAEKREKALREELAQKEKIAKELKSINEYADKKIAEQETVIKDLLQALNSTEKLRDTPLLPPGASAIAAAKKVLIVGGKDDWPPNVKGNL